MFCINLQTMSSIPIQQVVPARFRFLPSIMFFPHQEKIYFLNGLEFDTHSCYLAFEMQKLIAYLIIRLPSVHDFSCILYIDHHLDHNVKKANNFSSTISGRGGNRSLDTTRTTFESIIIIS